MFRPTSLSAAPGRLFSGSRLWLVFLVAGVLALGQPVASQATPAFTVCPSGCPYSTISAAIAAAHPGATILVGPGTYREALIIGKPLTIQGVSAQQTIVAGPSGRQPGVTVAAHPVRLADLTVTGFARGISNESGATLTVVHSTVSNNYRDGGISNAAGATLMLTHSTVSGNSAGRGSSGGGLANDGTAVVTSSQLLNNSATVDGGGIANSAKLTLTHTTVSGNRTFGSTSRGGGLFNAGTATVTFDKLLNNSTGTGGGGAIYSTSTKVKLEHTEVRGNSTPQCVPTTLC